MNWAADILMILSAVGVVNSIFFIVILLRNAVGKPVANQALALLLLFLTLRTSKTVFFYFSGPLDETIVIAGFATLLLVGPGLYLYFRVMVHQLQRLPAAFLWHFVPAFALLVISPFIHYDAGSTAWRAGHLVIILHVLAYILISGAMLLRKQRGSRPLQKKPVQWLMTVWILTLLIWAAYFMHYPLRTGPYINGAIVFTLAVYIAFYRWFRLNSKGRNLHDLAHALANDEQQNELYASLCKRLDQLLNENLEFKSSNISLAILAKELNTQPYLLSKAINEVHKTNVNGLINRHRIDEAKRLLRNPQHAALTIASIAWEVGFNSLSSFNAAFKKSEGMTPSQFRNQD